MATSKNLNTGESRGIMYAIRLDIRGEEEVMRQVARLDQALNLLRGGRSSKGAFYNASKFGSGLRNRFSGKGSRNFRNQIRALMVHCATEICVDLITRTRGTTGNAAFSWHVSITRNDAEQEHGRFDHDPRGYLRALSDAHKSRSQYDTAKALAIARERGNEHNADLQPMSRNGYTIYISNYAFVAPFGTEVGNLIFEGFYTRFMLDSDFFGEYHAGFNLSSQGMDDFVQRKFKELFNEGLKNIR